MSASQGEPLLSVAMIGKNAAELIGATLESIKEIADQIVVLDTGSTDRTVAIAREAGAIVVEKPWQNSFSAARNAAWSHVRGKWVLWLDSGETIDAAAARELRTFVERQANLSTAYVLLVVKHADEGQIAGEQAARIRLVPNRPDIRFIGRVAETLTVGLEQAGLTIEGLPWRIERSPLDQRPEVKLAKARRNLRLAAMDCQPPKEKRDLLVVMGEALNALGDATQAITAFRKAIALSDEPTSAMREAYYGLLTAMDAEPNLRAQQMAVCAEALERFPTDAQLLCAMGGYLQTQGKLDMAARAYESAYRHGQIDPWTWHVTGIDEIAVACLSLIRQLQNQDSIAQEVLEEALAKLPQANRIRRQLIELHIKHNRREEALSQLDQLHGEIPHREAFRSAIRGACLAAQQNWAAALGYLRTAYAAECRDVICLRWLTVTMIAMGDLDHARPVLLEWQAAEPASAEVQQYLSLYGSAANGGAANSGRTGVEFIDLSEDDGRSLRVDDGSAAGQTLTGKPNFAQGPVRTIHEHGSRQR